MKIIGHDAVFACGLLKVGCYHWLYTDGKRLCSLDGLQWEPLPCTGLEGLCQVQVVKEGDKNPNCPWHGVLKEGTGNCICSTKWLAFGWKPDGSGAPYRPGIRYEEYESTDGRDWKPTGRVAVTMDKVGDSVNMYWEDGDLILYAQAWNPARLGYQVKYDNLPDKQRVIQRWRRDRTACHKWYYDEIIFEPTESDPWDLQFYYFSTYKNTGFLGLYHCAAQTTDIEICKRENGEWKRTGVVVDCPPYVNLYTARTVIENPNGPDIMLMQMSLDFHNYEIPPGKRWDLGAWEYREEWPEKIRPMD